MLRIYVSNFDDWGKMPRLVDGVFMIPRTINFNFNSTFKFLTDFRIFSDDHRRARFLTPRRFHALFRFVGPPNLRLREVVRDMRFFMKLAWIF